MLEYQNAALMDLVDEDGLLVMARGLGIEEVILNVLKIYCDSSNLVLVIGTTPKEEQYFINQLERDNIQKLPKAITSDCAVSDRTSVYNDGGVLFVTSRILVVDMLKCTLPTELVTAVIICKAHKVLDSSQEAFILRLYRQNNKTGSIKAFSDYPEAFTRGFCQVERVMKNLFLGKLYLYPRFHSNVNNCLERDKPQVFEVRLPLTESMVDIQTALLDLIAICVKDLKKCNPTLDLEDVSSENALNEAFDKIIKFQLEPMWHQLSTKTKQLISDLRDLRSILINLTQYDCVTFYNLLESLKTYEKVLQNTGWLFLPAAEALFLNAQKRVYGKRESSQKKSSAGAKKPSDKKNSKVVAIEENPKWIALTEIVLEIFNDIDKNKLPLEGDRLLIAASDNQTCEQIKEVLCSGSANLLHRLSDKYHNSKKGLAPEAGKSVDDKRLGKRKRDAVNEQSKGTGILSFSQLMSHHDIGSSDEAAQHSPKSDPDTMEFTEEPLVLVESLKYSEQALGIGQTLTEVKPRFIIMYDSSLTFIRQLEVYRAQNSDMKIVVYWLVYETSAEEQRYLTIIRKEKEAFEMLIRQKGDMVIPKDRDGRSEGDTNLMRGTLKANETVNADGGLSTRHGGIDRSEDRLVQHQIIVDMREFRSELPSLIHRRGIDIVPVTLEVGDYILTPDICVERKSVNDLIESLNSGRLHSQATAMCRFYKRPMLLIEFDSEKPFGFQGRYISKEISTNDFTSKLLLLTIHFPNLKILWCPSPYATAEIFEELKNGRDQPSAEEAMKISEIMGSQAGSVHSLEKYNPSPRNFLMLMPGVDSKNCNAILNHAGSLDELARDWPQERLHKLLENAGSAKKIWESLHMPITSPAAVQGMASSSRGRHGKWAKKS